MDIKNLVTLEDIIDKFKVSRMTVHNWRKSKKDPLKTVKVGNLSSPILFDLPEVDAWSERNNKGKENESNL